MALYATTQVITESGEYYTFLQYGSDTVLTVRNAEGEYLDGRSSVGLPENLEIGKNFSYNVYGEVQRPTLVLSPVVGFSQTFCKPNIVHIEELFNPNLSHF